MSQLHKMYASQFMGGGEGFPNPFLDLSSLSVPQSWRNVLYWMEYVYSLFGTYAAARERVNSYFLTDVEFGRASDDETEKWQQLFNDQLDVISVEKCLLRDTDCYGNGFASVLVPFRRHLACPYCPKRNRGSSEWALAEVYNNPRFAFEFKLPEFVATCPKCEYRGAFRLEDRPEDDEDRLKIKLWSPHDIEILHDPYTGDTAYLWRIPEDYKLQVKRGNLYHLERVSQEVLKAIQYNQHFRFSDDAIYHMKEPTLSGILNRGWGLPGLLMHFRQVWYVQVLRRFNEAIALDYVIPFRLITPQVRSSSSAAGGMAMDPLMVWNGGEFRNNVLRMIRGRRKDPAQWNVLPFPVEYHMLGGDANKLAPRELLDQGMEQLLNDVGTPVELYKGSLQLQTAPVALRLFEVTHHHRVHMANTFLRWLVRQISQILSWETIDAKLKRVTIADDIERQTLALQLMMSQHVSATTALKQLNYDYKKEQKQLGEEALISAEVQARSQEEMEQAGFAQQVAQGQLPGGPGGGAPGGGGGAPGGAPAGGGGDLSGVPAGGMATAQGPVTAYLASAGPNTPQSPQDMLAVADSIAQQLLGLPEPMKDSELRKLRMANEVLANQVKDRMSKQRQQTRSQAGNAVLAQWQQTGQPPQ